MNTLAQFILEASTFAYTAFVAALCVTIAWIVITLVGQIREGGESGRVWRSAAIVVIGGLGVWAVHFLAMLSYRPDYPLSYEPQTTAVSALLALLLIGTPLALSARASGAIGRFTLGAGAGAGVAVMHFVGMAALRGCIVVHPVGTQLALGALGAVVLGTALALPQRRRRFRWLACGLAVACVLLVHFLAMTAMQIAPAPETLALGIYGDVFSNVIALAVLALLVLSAVVCFWAIRIGEERRHSARLTTALAHMSNGLLAIAADGTVDIANEQFFHIIGLPPTPVRRGMAWRSFIRGNCRLMGWDEPRTAALLALHEDWSVKRTRTQLTMQIGKGRTISVGSEPLPDGGFVVILNDVTELLDQAAKAEASERTFKLMVRGITDYAIYMLNPDGTVANWNAGAERLKGYSAEEIVGTHFSRFYSEAEREAGMPDRNLATALREGRFEKEGLRYRKDGSTFLAHVVIDPIYREDGSLLGFGKIIRDRTEYLQSTQHLAHVTRHDALTGLPNRAHFLERLGAALEALETQQGSGSDPLVAAVSIDVNGFKAINDTYGHAIGDTLLQALACRMSACLQGGELVARFGSDEFMAFKRYRERGELDAFVARLSQAVNQPVQLLERRLNPGTSLGVACYPMDARTSDALIARADLAMHRAKASLETSVCFFEPKMDEAARERRMLTADIWTAIEAGDQFHVHYQSQHCTQSGAVSGYEALLRWRHPERGAIPPAVFIPLAENCGAIVKLGEQIMEQACRDAVAFTLPRVAVNLSPFQLNDPALPERVQAILTRTGLPPSRLEFEVTESAVIDDRSRALDILRRIKAIGITIAMDDFGTGYSSLETLRAFPFDRLKLDRSFTRGLDDDPQAQAFVHAIMSLANSLAMTVVAEGIELPSQVHFLNDVGCHELQGYLFGRPCAIEQIRAEAPRAALHASLMAPDLAGLAKTGMSNNGTVAPFRG